MCTPIGEEYGQELCMCNARMGRSIVKEERGIQAKDSRII